MENTFYFKDEHFLHSSKCYYKRISQLPRFLFLCEQRKRNLGGGLGNTHILIQSLGPIEPLGYHPFSKIFRCVIFLYSLYGGLVSGMLYVII